MNRPGAAPCQCFLAGLEEDAVARPDLLDRAAAALRAADALDDEDRLPVRGGVCRGRPRAGREVDERPLDARGVAGRPRRRRGRPSR